MKRVRVDHPDFPWLPFNSLRDKSANMVRQLAGEEVASLHLAHKHQSKDENLRRYTNPVRKPHFKALRRVERRLSVVFTAAGDAPWVQPTKNYMGRARLKKSVSFGVRACRPR